MIRANCAFSPPRTALPGAVVNISLHSGEGGLAPDPASPGYKHFFVRPLIGPQQLDSARAELETPYGKASSGWVKRQGKVEMDVVVPPNTTATIEFPDHRSPETVEAGTYHFQLNLR